MAVGDRVKLDLGKACIVNGAEDAGKIGLRLAAEHEELDAEGDSVDIGEGAGRPQEAASRGCGE
jgi:hypothetical protein